MKSNIAQPVLPSVEAKMSKTEIRRQSVRIGIPPANSAVRQRWNVSELCCGGVLRTVSLRGSRRRANRNRPPTGQSGFSCHLKQRRKGCDDGTADVKATQILLQKPFMANVVFRCSLRPLGASFLKAWETRVGCRGQRESVGASCPWAVFRTEWSRSGRSTFGGPVGRVFVRFRGGGRIWGMFHPAAGSIHRGAYDGR